MSSFSHPLARDAKVWRSGGLSDPARNVLVVITTLELDPGRKRFKAELVERLSAAARAWVAENGEAASDFLLMNRPKKWAGDKD
jgi:hypothetical protein